MDRQQAVLDILRELRGDRPLKQLFWTELNYDRVNTPLPRKGWGEHVSAALAEDPVLFATGGNDFHVIHARLNSDKLQRGVERSVVSRLLQNHPYALFVFSNANQDRWHFLNVKYDDDDVQRRRLFRRITIGPEERPYLRTASERLDKINLADARDHAPITIQKLHDDAFDVEPVTKEFFREYGRIFGEVENSIRRLPDDERKRLFTQRLFNRIMFIAFIQKKGWLKLDGDADYLSALWRAHQRDSTIADKNFYRDRLKPLFFFGLDSTNEVNQVGINRGGFLKTLIGEVPYLNGGLFEEDEDDRDSSIVIPDKALGAILNDLFARFNFTVTESTPLDVEVAVDPEMLGKVFEKLVTGRHETGSYYTPKSVVGFMCREALKGHLEARLFGEAKQAIEEFVDTHNPANLRNAEAVLEDLRQIKVCDPACGSGAYLVGMLHELLDLRACLFATKKLDAKSVYDRKLEIIQNNLYGVDLDPFAINIASLRLWLSLAVDFEGNDPPPLPNLDFKIERGDSLTAPDVGQASQASFRQTQIDDYLRLKRGFMAAHGTHKQELRRQIEAAKRDISIWTHGRKSVAGFDWPVEFAEVFTSGGFDVILANPPYVRADAQFKHISGGGERQAAIAKWKQYRETLLDTGIYESLYEKWDLYLPFLERAYQLLSRDGQMVFIISDAYNAAKYAKKSHEFFLRESEVRRIDFCSEIRLFNAVVNNTILHFEKSPPDSSFKPVRVRRFGKGAADFDINIQMLPSAPQREQGAALFRPDQKTSIEYTGAKFVPLGDICYVSVGMVIHCDEKKSQGAFKAEDLISDHRDEKHPKPYAEGKDIVRYGIPRVRFLEYGTRRAPSMFRRPTFPELYEPDSRLLALRMCGDNPAAAIDHRQLMTNHTVIIFVPWHKLRGVRNQSIKKTAKYRKEVKLSKALSKCREDMEELSKQFDPKYLLAIMNSTVAKEFLNKRRRSKLDIYPDDWKLLPIPRASLAEQAHIARLVARICDFVNKNGSPPLGDAATRFVVLDQEIDSAVRSLYASCARAAAS